MRRRRKAAGAWRSAGRCKEKEQHGIGAAARRFRDEKCNSRDVERRSSNSFGHGEEKRSSEGRRRASGGAWEKKQQGGESRAGSQTPV